MLLFILISFVPLPIKFLSTSRKAISNKEANQFY
jgi:hypothetical protein